MPYAGKSLIVHIKAARNVKFSFLATSYVNSPIHNLFKSSINGCKYTSIPSVGFDGPGIIQLKNKYGFVMHISGGRLYGVRIIGQQE
jgi:hypothetical protein